MSWFSQLQDKQRAKNIVLSLMEKGHDWKDIVKSLIEEGIDKNLFSWLHDEYVKSHGLAASSISGISK